MQCRIKVIIYGSVLACIEGYVQGTGEDLVDCSNSGTASCQCASVLASNPEIEIKQYGNGFKFALLNREGEAALGSPVAEPESSGEPIRKRQLFPSKNLLS